MSAWGVLAFLLLILYAGARLLPSEDKTLLGRPVVRMAIAALLGGMYLTLADVTPAGGWRLTVGGGLMVLGLLIVLIVTLRTQPFGPTMERVLDSEFRSEEFQAGLRDTSDSGLWEFYQKATSLPKASASRATLMAVVAEEMTHRGLRVPDPRDPIARPD